MRMCTVLAPIVLCATGHAQEAGPWRGVLASPGGEIAFGMQLESTDAGPVLWLTNGEERRRIPRLERSGGRLVAHLDPYDSRLEATVSEDGRSMRGQWVRYRSEEQEIRLPFEAVHGVAPRYSVPADRATPAAGRAARAALDGRWRVEFSSSSEPAVGLFELPRDDGRLLGTFLTVLGDYRFLEGVATPEGFELSVFDGAHAFLFKARVQPDGSLAGDFWSRDSWHETWTAVRDARAALPEAWGLTRWTGEVPLGELRFPDAQGKRWSLDDPRFHGRARLLVLFGTWCPNCYDESTYLVELRRRYGMRGLAVLGLAFEFGEDFERQARVVERYREHHGIDYPVLIAGTSDKRAAGRAFPLLDQVRAYPTTLFIDAEGQVHAVYTGFSGPATGAAHQRLRERWETLIEELLSTEDR